MSTNKKTRQKLPGKSREVSSLPRISSSAQMATTTPLTSPTKAISTTLSNRPHSEHYSLRGAGCLTTSNLRAAATRLPARNTQYLATVNQTRPYFIAPPGNILHHIAVPARTHPKKKKKLLSFPYFQIYVDFNIGNIHSFTGVARMGSQNPNPCIVDQEIKSYPKN